MRILLVEDDVMLADAVTRALRQSAHSVQTARTGVEADQALSGNRWDLVLLDVGLPKMDGFEVLRRLRQRRSPIPVLILTVRDSVEDLVTGLDLGADDYLTKPFDFDELLARIEALVRRSHSFAPSSNVLKVADLVLDRELLEVRRGTDTIKLTAKELAILELLMSAPGRVFSRTRILNQVWGYSEDPLTNVVDVYIARLRRKIDTPGREPLLETVRGHGYRLRAPT